MDGGFPYWLHFQDGGYQVAVKKAYTGLGQGNRAKGAVAEADLYLSAISCHLRREPAIAQGLLKLGNPRFVR